MQPTDKMPQYFENDKVPFLKAKLTTDTLRDSIPSYTSSTAIIVNRDSSKYDEKLKEQSKALKELRKEYGPNFCGWITRTSLFKSPGMLGNGGMDILFEAKVLEELKKEVPMVFQEINKNGMWNCSEYAFYTWFTIKARNLLSDGFEAHVAFLNDQKVPASEYYEFFKDKDGHLFIEQELNHDHAFVVITDKMGKFQYVVDSWLSQIKPYKRTFVGTVQEFIAYIASNKDGHYVRKGLKQEHICLIADELSKKRLEAGNLF